MSPADLRISYRHLVLSAIVLVAAGSMALVQGGSEHPDGAAGTAVVTTPMEAFHDGSLSLEDRVRYQRRIEEVYWRHRIWPAENPGPKPGLDAVLPDAAIRERVSTQLEKSGALDLGGSQTLTGEQIQAEVNRMVRETKNPDVLRELFAALDDDPFLVAECLARPVLTERLTRNRSAAEKSMAVPGLADPITPVSPPSGGYRLPTPHGSGCTADTWTEFSYAPSGSANHTVVWTGSEMVVWGGGSYLHTGGRYDPATDSWTATSTGAGVPTGRVFHTAVWTGTEMIIWGGYDGAAEVDTGGRYDPATDSWSGTSTGDGAPTARVGHTAVWTGTEMIVWGGDYYDDDDSTTHYFDTGGRYDPATDSWTVTSTGTGLPTARGGHTAVSTGTEMIVWGGYGEGEQLNTGGRYDPATDSWTVTSTGTGLPTARVSHTAVWTGTEMIVWGGAEGAAVLDTGGRYDPETDSWSATSSQEGTPTPRNQHTAVWTGTEMIVWGGWEHSAGSTFFLNTGGRYDPETDSWTETSTGTGVPAGRRMPAAVWTGTEMIVWGGADGEGSRNTGGRYDPATDSWTETSPGAGVPISRREHTAVWTGAEMIVWGGYHSVAGLDTGGRYDPATDSWTVTSTGAGVPDGRRKHTAIWTGTEMIVWGGNRAGTAYLNTGGRYDPATDSWTATSTGAGVPAGSDWPTAVWTGREMIVWGGRGPGTTFLNTGGRYDPETDSWTATSTGAGVPSGRAYHTAVWTGAEMVVWGGAFWDGSWRSLDSGGLYDPATDSWRETSPGAGVPISRSYHTAVWTGTEMIVWGGYDDAAVLDTGGRYDPLTDSWTVTSATSGVLTERALHTTVWTGTEMIVWGGWDGGDYADSGARYDPLTDGWTATSTATGVPVARRDHTAAWTGTEMIVWGGFDGTAVNNGGLYCACEEGSVDTWFPDADGDGHGVASTGIPSCSQPSGYVAVAGDCDDTSLDTYPGAVEVNDGLDNQCPGDLGHGVVDEISGVTGFHNPEDENELSWTAQAGATSYEIARSANGYFVTDCETWQTAETFWIDTDPLPAGGRFHYLVRALQPNPGSWGATSAGTERSWVCP